jgi:putative permease
MNKVFFWIIFFCIAISFLCVISNTLAPFLIAFIIAYLLQPLIDKSCKKFKMPRWVIASGIFILFVGTLVISLVVLIPIVYQQVALFISKIPNYKSNFEHGVLIINEKFYTIDPQIADKITASLQSFIDSTFTILGSFANHLWQYTMATINLFIIIVVVPVILYYLLRDWPKMVKSIKALLPMKGKKKIEEIFISIDELLSAYIRGQLNICLILSIYYAVCLSIMGLDLAILLGILAGFLVILPFIGVALTFLLVLMNVYFAYGIGVKLLYVSLIFVIGHIIESYVLSPQIIGEKIGLHPVWIIFAVFAGGNILGFVGILFALPIAGIIKILLTHLISYYKSTKIYSN